MITAATVAAGAIGGAVGLPVTAAARRAGSFDVLHGDDVYVTMTVGRPFTVEVHQRGTRLLLERHDGVTTQTLLALRSEYVTFVERR